MGVIVILVSFSQPAIEHFSNPILRDCYEWGFLEPQVSILKTYPGQKQTRGKRGEKNPYPTQQGQAQLLDCNWGQGGWFLCPLELKGPIGVDMQGGKLS